MERKVIRERRNRREKREIGEKMEGMGGKVEEGGINARKIRKIQREET